MIYNRNSNDCLYNVNITDCFLFEKRSIALAYKILNDFAEKNCYVPFENHNHKLIDNSKKNIFECWGEFCIDDLKIAEIKFNNKFYYTAYFEIIKLNSCIMCYGYQDNCPICVACAM